MQESAVCSPVREAQLKPLVETALQLCGLAEYGVFGDHSAAVVQILTEKGVWASCLSLEQGDTLASEEPSHKPEVVVGILSSLASAPEQEIESTFSRLYQATEKFLLLNVNNVPASKTREDMELPAFAAGFRLHARALLACGYDARNGASGEFFLCFEKIPASILNLPLAKKIDENLPLPLDILRTTGRNSDARMMQYFMASEYIRPGDTVLDCACGSGSGAHILYQNSRARKIVGFDASRVNVDYAIQHYSAENRIEFHQANGQSLSELLDNSVDCIVGFDIMESLTEPDRYLAELYRVLRPSGRVFLCASHHWADEAGTLLNPMHLHEYSWSRLYEEVERYFILDRAFLQTAGGGVIHQNAPRSWIEVPCMPQMEKSAEWVLFWGMKDPLVGRDVPYVETTFPAIEDPAYHVGAFSRDYRNPWLLKGMISMGYRLHNATALEKLQDAVLQEYPPDSVDYGAALCGHTYRLCLQRHTAQYAPIIEACLARIEQYAAVSSSFPHLARWKVSNLYAGALLLQKQGRFTQAEDWYLRCADFDVLPYSPLLGNRVIQALYAAALFALSRKDIELARVRLEKALAECQRLLQGPWINIIGKIETPFEPGLPEIAQMADLSARCSYLIGLLDSYLERPGYAYQYSKGWFEFVLAEMKKHEESLIRHCEQLQRSLDAR